MITEKEVPDVLEKELPEITAEVEANKGNIFRVLNSFAMYTKKCAEIGNVNKLKKCFDIADRLLREGNDKVKTVVENIYIISFETLMDFVSHGKNTVNIILPDSLKIAYKKHVENLYALADYKNENC